MMDKKEILDWLETIYRDMARTQDLRDYWELKTEVSSLLESLKWLMDDIRLKSQ